MTSVRETPLGQISADWWAEYRVIGREDGIACQSEGTAIYSPHEGNVSRYDVPDWAVRCLESGPPIAVTYVRRVLLLGVIPLRAATYRFTINPEAAPIIDSGEAESQP